MYLTEKEIFAQYDALRQTYDYMVANSDQIRGLIDEVQPKSLTFIGCGSGYCLCRSGEISTKIRLGLPANALAAGDLLVNFEHYREMLKDTLIIAPSRSGGTSEVIRAVEKAKAIGVKTLGIAAQVDAPLSEVADLTLEIPWAFDESVCQTRTVSNLYTTNLILLGIIGNDEELLQEIDQTITDGDSFMEKHTDLAKTIAATDWENVVVLADSELDGIASEAAIAFIEIPQTSASYYHVLDVRHGPMVLITEKTLVVMAPSSEETELQKGVISDLRAKGAKVLTVSEPIEGDWGADWEVYTPKYENFGVLGIPFIFMPQAISFYKALERGLNPDLPSGLKPMISLDSK